MREQNKELTKNFDKSENDLKALQSVGQIVGEVLKQLTEDKCKFFFQSIQNSVTNLNFQLLLKQQMVPDTLSVVAVNWIKQN